MPRIRDLLEMHLYLYFNIHVENFKYEEIKQMQKEWNLIVRNTSRKCESNVIR